MIKPGSQNDRIVKALTANGGWMKTAELYDTVGGCSLNSRVSELREVHGYDIPCRPIEGMPAGPEAQEYKLVATPSKAEGYLPSSSVLPGVSVTVADGCLPDAGAPDFQLSFLDSASAPRARAAA